MKVAVIGGGIAGISAAWHLEQGGAQVVLYEANRRIGGHTDTHLIQLPDGPVAVDTGFIVFNRDNYPGFSQWLNTLGVDDQASDMSFAVRDQVTGLEYGTTDLQAITANRGQLLRPRYWRLWRDLTRFYRTLGSGEVPDISLGEYLDRKRYSNAFTEGHLLPMCAALWSQTLDNTQQLSLPSIVRFMRNHKLLQVAGRPQWRVVAGGSSVYLDAFLTQFKGTIRTGARARIARGEAGVMVGDGRGQQHFDAVVMACHSDQALNALTDPSAAEHAVLGALPYHTNQVYLHTDASIMPRNRQCWSSWNVVREAGCAYTITYWMNRLQGLRCGTDLFVTLNPDRALNGVRWQGVYAHPLWNAASADAQARWSEISTGQTAYAGAYWGAGFHEDGFDSGRRAAEQVLLQRTRQHAA